MQEKPFSLDLVRRGLRLLGKDREGAAKKGFSTDEKLETASVHLRRRRSIALLDYLTLDIY